MLSIHETVRLELRGEIFIFFCISWNKWVGLFHSLFNVQNIKKYKAKQNNNVFSDNLGRFSLIFGHNGFSKVCVIIWPFFAFFVEFSLQPVRRKGDIVVKGFGLYVHSHFKRGLMLAYKIQSIDSQYISFQTAINTVQKNKHYSHVYGTFKIKFLFGVNNASNYLYAL